MIQVQIDKLAYGGSGFGNIAGKACFVPYTAPGDLAVIRMVKEKNSYCEGVLEELLCSSIHRTSPQCPLFGKCGGCDWQHIAYSEQFCQKEQIFADILWRSARVNVDKIKPILSAVAPFGYRSRIQLKVNYSGGRLSLGFHRRASHHVIDINDCCAIAAVSLNLAIPAVRELISSAPEPDKIPQVDLASSADGSVSALFHYVGIFPESLSKHLARTEHSYSMIHSVSIQAGKKSRVRHLFGLQRLKYSVPCSKVDELELYYLPYSFSQINFAQNRVIVDLLLDLCSIVSPVSVLDLYCGNGNFSLPLAGRVQKVLGFESSEKSISSAKYNAAVNGIDNARYICLDSATGLEKLAADREFFDLVLMDPPRTGADDVSRIVSKSGASHLIYVSCDPPTLGRDISTLEKFGFEVISIQPVDMFPQTYHLESVTLLKAT